MTERTFHHLEQALEKSVSELKKTKDPDLRRKRLLEMRLLLVEADRLLLEMPESSSGNALLGDCPST